MMKNLLAILTASFLCMNSVLSHGIDGHVYRAENERDVSRDQQASSSGKSLTEPAIEQKGRWWKASLSTGWTSREMHYGVDETADYGAYTTSLGLRLRNLTLSVWSGFGTGNEYQEWDFTLAYNLELGRLFFAPGYNFRYQPGIVEDDHDETAPEGHDHTNEGHDDDEENSHHHESGPHEEGGHSHTGHSHNTDAHELCFLLGTTAIPYVTPGMLFVWDLANTPGVYMEFRLDGHVRIHREVLSLQPYVLLGLNFGYNTRDYYGWNHFQFGVKATWKISHIVSVFGGVSYSVAMTALKEIDQGNEVWANAGVTLSY